MVANPNALQTNENQPNFRVLIADDDGVFGRILADFLREKGFGVMIAAEGKAARKMLKEYRPHFLLADLTLMDGNAFELLKFINTDPDVKAMDVKTFVISVHTNPENIRALLKAGACDFVLRPFKNDDLLTRLIFQIQNKREITAPQAKSEQKADGADLYLQLMEIVLQEAVQARSMQDILFKLVKMVSLTLKAVRCSVIEVADNRIDGFVMASSDDRGARGIRLDLNRYPEVMHVVNTEKAVVIENIDDNPQLAAIRNMFKNISFNSMLVCPLFQRGQIYGVLSARMDKTASKFNERDLRFAQLVTQVGSLVLSSDLSMPHEFFAPRTIVQTAGDAPNGEGSGNPEKKAA